MVDPTLAGSLLLIGAYALGSVLFGVLFARRKGVDLRAIGSGNVGATNVSRALGKSAGRWVMVLDALKGAAPVALGVWLFGAASPWTAGAGLAATVGHIFPLWHRFRGGKGAATAAGSMIAAAPGVGLGAFAAFVVVKKLTRQASLGSLSGALVGIAICFARHGVHTRFAMTVILASLVAARHHENIRRLVRKEELDS